MDNDRKMVNEGIIDDDIIAIDCNDEHSTYNQNRLDESIEPISAQDTCTSNERDLLDHCPKCKNKFKLTSSPKMLACLHSYCEACLNSIRNNKNSPHYTCLVCGVGTNVDLVIDNVFTYEDEHTKIQETQVVSQAAREKHTHVVQQKCTNCDENNCAEWFCLDCKEWLCEECKSAHARVKLTKDHVIEHKKNADLALNNDLSSNGKQLFCRMHKCERLNVYCETCETLTCRDCQLSLTHKDHSHKYIQDAAKSQRDYFDDWLKKVRARKCVLNDVKTKIEERQSEMDFQSESIINEIKIVSSKIAIEINNRAGNLIDGLQKICKDKQVHLTLNKLDLQKRLRKFDHCISVLESAIKSDNQTAVLMAKKAFASHVASLLEEKCEVLNPNHRFKIDFVHEDVKTIRSLSSLGYLIIDGQTYGQQNVQQNGQLQAINVSNNEFNSIHTHQQQQQQQTSNRLIRVSNGSSPKSILQQVQTLVNPHNNQRPQLAGHIIIPGNNQVAPPRGIIQQPPRAPPNLKIISSPLNANGTQQINKQVIMAQNTSSSSSPSSLTTLSPPQITPTQRLSGFQAPRPMSHLIPQRFARISQPPQMSGKQINPRPSLTEQQQRPQVSAVPTSFAQKRKSDDISTNTDESTQPNKTKSLSTISENSMDWSESVAKKLTNQVHNAFSNTGALSSSGVDIKKEKMDVVEKPQQQPSTQPRLNHSSDDIPQVTQNEAIISSSVNSQRGSIESLATLNQQSTTKSKFQKEHTRTPSEDSQLTSASTQAGTSDETSVSECGNQSNQSTSPSVTNLVSEILLVNENDIPSEVCIICRSRGVEVCCNYCPRSYHIVCHVPTLSKNIEAPWRCGLCEDIECIAKSKYDSESGTSISSSGISKRKAVIGLSKWELKMCQRILLLLYCQTGSQAFHEPVSSRGVPNYYKVIKKPMDFSKIRSKLSRGHFDHYKTFDEFVNDVLLVFSNCTLYNTPESSISKTGNEIKQRFLNFLNQYVPEFMSTSKSSTNNKSANSSLTADKSDSNLSITNESNGKSQLSPSSEASTSTSTTSAKNKRTKRSNQEELSEPTLELNTDTQQTKDS